MELAKAEILIVGAGIIGLNIARELVKTGHGDIVIIEKEPELGRHGRANWSPLDPSVFLRKIPLTDTCIHFHLTMDVLQNIVVETTQAWYKRPWLKQKL